MAKSDDEIRAIRRLAHSLNTNQLFNSLVVATEHARAEIFRRSNPTTLQALIDRFNGPTAPLEVVASEFFGLGRQKAYEYAALNKLPLPTFRCTESNKAPLLVHVEDLAEVLDARRAAARAEWIKSQI